MRACAGSFLGARIPSAAARAVCSIFFKCPNSTIAARSPRASWPTNASASSVNFSAPGDWLRDILPHMKWVFLLLTVLVSTSTMKASSVRLTDQQALEIGKRIWKNECAGTVSGLTSWNKGEEFPSLGIAHFIWYPADRRGPFEESWPGLARFLKERGVPVQDWMLGTCPWKTRDAFVADLEGEKLSGLRNLLSKSVAEQARFAAIRMESSLPKMLAAAGPGKAALVKANFERVAAQPLGFYALMDYVNFKGEGINPEERYNGHGWGLLQVLESMPSSSPALPAFAHAADSVLTLRVKNAPPARNESKWLPGWRNRLQTYLQ